MRLTRALERSRSSSTGVGGGRRGRGVVTRECCFGHAHRPLGSRQDVLAHRLRDAARSGEDRAGAGRPKAYQSWSFHAAPRNRALGHQRTHPVGVPRADAATPGGQASPRRHHLGQLHAQTESAEPAASAVPGGARSVGLQATGPFALTRHGGRKRGGRAGLRRDALR